MKTKNIGTLLFDWIKGSHRGGQHLSEHLAGRLEMSPQNGRVAGGIFDLAIGSLLTYMATTSAISAVASAVVAVGAVATAPVAAVAAVAVGAVFLTLSTMTAAFSTGLLSAAYKKSGLPSPATVARAIKNLFRRKNDKNVKFLRQALNTQIKIAQRFKLAANANKQQAKQEPKPAPKSVNAPKL